MLDIIAKRSINTTHNLRGQHKLVVSRYNTCYMKNSVAHRGSITWNALLTHMIQEHEDVH